MDSNGEVLGRERLLSFTKERRYKTFEIENVGKFRIQSLTEAERVQIEKTIWEDSQDSEEKELSLAYKAHWIIGCLVDGNNLRIFADSDVDQIMEMDSAVTEAIFGQIRDHCAVSEEEIRELAKN